MHHVTDLYHITISIFSLIIPNDYTECKITGKCNVTKCVCRQIGSQQQINTLRPRQNGGHFADDIFKCIFLNETICISIQISLKFVPKGPINNISAWVQIMACRRPGDKPLSELMMASLLTHICVTRPQWVKKRNSSSQFVLRTSWMWILSTPKLPLISVSKCILCDIYVLNKQFPCPKRQSDSHFRFASIPSGTHYSLFFHFKPGIYAEYIRQFHHICFHQSNILFLEYLLSPVNHFTGWFWIKIYFTGSSHRRCDFGNSLNRYQLFFQKIFRLQCAIDKPT